MDHATARFEDGSVLPGNRGVVRDPGGRHVQGSQSAGMGLQLQEFLGPDFADAEHAVGGAAFGQFRQSRKL